MTGGERMAGVDEARADILAGRQVDRGNDAAGVFAEADVRQADRRFSEQPRQEVAGREGGRSFLSTSATEFGRVDARDTDGNREIDAEPDAHVGLERVAVDDAQDSGWIRAAQNLGRLGREYEKQGRKGGDRELSHGR